jgi:hypothetical protein
LQTGRSFEIGLFYFGWMPPVNGESGRLIRSPAPPLRDLNFSLCWRGRKVTEHVPPEDRRFEVAAYDLNGSDRSEKNRTHTKIRRNPMKRTFVLLVGMLMLSGIVASAELNFALGDGAVTTELPLLNTADFATAILPNTMLFNEAGSSVTIAQPIVLPEPTAGTLLLISIAVAGWCKRRQSPQS